MKVRLHPRTCEATQYLPHKLPVDVADRMEVAHPNLKDGDWVVEGPAGQVVLTNALFTLLFEPIEV